MSEAPVDDSRFPLARISNIALLAAIAFATLALRRYATFHNETFDLAFYTRLVWGLGHGDQYQPLTNSYFWGLHAAPILFVLGQLGRLLPIVPMLLVLQAASVAAAGIPLARIAARRVGHPLAADFALIAYLFYPTVGSVATYEFHPSTLALFPLALALESFDRRALRNGLIALACAVACREDVALVAALMGVSLAMRKEFRKPGIIVFLLGITYFCVYLFVIAPRYLPRHGSLNLHYGNLGASPGSVVRTMLFHPIATFRAVVSPVKLLYGPRMLAPVAFLSLIAPRWLLPALVPFGINFLSQFPTAVEVSSHYAALSVPFIFASAAHGAGRLAAGRPGSLNRYVLLVGAAVAIGTLVMQHRAGATPLSRRWDPSAFHHSTRQDELTTLMKLVPHDSSVVGPDYLLPHVAERPLIQRIPWTRGLDYVVLSTEYRLRFGATQDLWRSIEETTLRNMLASNVYGLYSAEGHHLLFRRGWPARDYARGRFVEVAPSDGPHVDHIDVGSSLAIAGWGTRAIISATVVTLFLVAKTPWPNDLAFELGWGPMHPVGDRQDPARIVSVLAFDGLFSPSHVRVGEVVRTEIILPAAIDEINGTTLYFGARRIDGSRLDANTAHWTALHLQPPTPATR